MSYFFKVERKYTGSYGNAWIFTLFSSRKIIRTKAIELKKRVYEFEYTDRLEIKSFLSKSDEVAKYDACI